MKYMKMNYIHNGHDQNLSSCKNSFKNHSSFLFLSLRFNNLYIKFPSLFGCSRKIVGQIRQIKDMFEKEKKLRRDINNKSDKHKLIGLP